MNWTAFADLWEINFGVEKWLEVVYETAALPSELRWRTMIIPIPAAMSTDSVILTFEVATDIPYGYVI